MIDEKFVTTNDYGNKFTQVQYLPKHPEMTRGIDYRVNGPWKKYDAPYGKVVGSHLVWSVRAFDLYVSIYLFDQGDKKHVVTFGDLYEWGRMDNLDDAIDRALDCMRAWREGYIVESTR